MITPEEFTLSSTYFPLVLISILKDTNKSGSFLLKEFEEWSTLTALTDPGAAGEDGEVVFEKEDSRVQF